jgi:hypothetical protein
MPYCLLLERRWEREKKPSQLPTGYDLRDVAPEPQLIQIDRDDQGHEESDSNHDIPASSQRQSELELSLHFPLPLSPDNLLHNSNN